MLADILQPCCGTALAVVGAVAGNTYRLAVADNTQTRYDSWMAPHYGQFGNVNDNMLRKDRAVRNVFCGLVYSYQLS